MSIIACQSNIFINHIIFLIDASGSMAVFRQKVVEVIDAQVAHLAEKSQHHDQETRVSLFYFNKNLQCHALDKDVLRLPSIKDTYKPECQTALIDATHNVLEELEQTRQTIGDHAFLMYVITDGEDNCSKMKPQQLKTRLDNLKDNWTVGVFVPGVEGIHEASLCGFPRNNIVVWEVKERGLEQAGELVKASVDNFMAGRPRGIRGTKNLFQADLSHVNVEQLEICQPGEYTIITIAEDCTVKGLGRGKVFYQLVKKEKVSASKEICILEKSTNHLYTGANARAMLSLPAGEIKLSPVEHDSFVLFIQSTSVNRKLTAGTQVVLMGAPSPDPRR